MSHQSGLAANQELLDAFARFKDDDNARALIMKIEGESVTAGALLERQQSDEQDLALLGEYLEAERPLFITYALREQSQYLFIQWVPDNAKVRDKMLASSTKATLLRNLGQPFVDTIWADKKQDLTPEAYARHLKHTQAAAPLTAREKEAEMVKTMEGVTVSGTGVKRSMYGAGNSGTSSAGVGLQWSEEAENAIKSFSEGEVVTLAIDVKSENIALSSIGTDLNLPTDAPSYTLAKLTNGNVFIYCCPTASPVKSRLVASSSASSVHAHVIRLGCEITKKMETSDPTEITLSSIQEELRGSQTQDENTPPVHPGEKQFSKPKRPGRK